MKRWDGTQEDGVNLRYGEGLMADEQPRTEYNMTAGRVNLTKNINQMRVYR